MERLTARRKNIPGGTSLSGRFSAMVIVLVVLIMCRTAFAQDETLFADTPMILIYMDEQQADHLRAYGVAYWCLQAARSYKVQWLLNYRGGSFMIKDSGDIRDRATMMGVTFKVIGPDAANRIYAEMKGMNSDVALLEKAPEVAVYVPPTENQWDDAVRMVLEYAKIPYETLWDREVVAGDLSKYDWLHLHHEDFTGQYGKFFSMYRESEWYKQMVRDSEQMASELGFTTVPRLKGAVAAAIHDFVDSGGFLFAMCSAPDSLDVAIAAMNTDIVPVEIDGTPRAANADEALDFSHTFAFKDFTVVADAYVYEVSSIDIMPSNINDPLLVPDLELFEFSARQDPALSIFVQNHTSRVHDFLGQTTAFNRKYLRDDVVVLGDKPDTDEVKYIHGNVGKGSFTFLGGHDPEDFRHLVGEKPTDVTLYLNSPGYRLILNNVLFPSLKKKEKKT